MIPNRLESLRLILPVLLVSLGFLVPASAQETEAPAEEAVAEETAAVEVVAEEAVAEEVAAEEVAVAPEPDEDLQALMDANGTPFDFFTISNLWILIAAALVLIMHLGFTCVETGLCRAKNTNNIIFKNVFIIAMGLLTYAIWGFNSMYPLGNWTIPNVFAIGSPIPTYEGPENLTFAYGGTALAMTAYADFIFQAMFAATAATIVSGAVAERVKLAPFMIFATILVCLVYPITGSWKWGEGWLDQMGFYDFAGSTLVHAFGGFAALACVIVLGPRLGKYTAEGKIRPILPHSTPLAAIGVFLLFLGWFGFNGGSVLSADPGLVGLVFVTTALAACAGGLATMFTGWMLTKKPDVSLSLNGFLAGLVGITAGADSVGVWESVLIGAIAGVLVVFSVIFLDKIKIDDPVGAISVHGTCGIWGTLAVGIFGEPEFVDQLVGTLAISAFAFVVSFILFYAIKLIMGVRVDAEEEVAGLDVAEHGSPAYAFEVTDHAA